MQQRQYVLCKDCRCYEDSECRSPANLVTSLVTGELRPDYTAQYLRENHAKCGRDGHWFVAKLVAA